MKLFGYNINIGRVQDASTNLPENKRLSKKITAPQTLYRVRQDVERWRSAVRLAEQIYSPNRTELLRLFKDVVLDAHLTACIETRKSQILQSEFKVVDKSGKEDEEKTFLLQNKWFFDFVNHTLDSKYYGFSLIQFLSLRDNVFDGVELIPREYVRQESNIVTHTINSFDGENYLQPEYKKWVIPVGDKCDLGILTKAAPLILWKKNAMGAWSEFTEMFGTPIRIGKTDVRDETTRSNMEGFLKNMGSSAWGLFDTNDIVELVESNKTDAYDVFDKLIERCNSEISKLILGQTGTTDEKSFSGSANVHERVLKMYGEADEMFIKNVFKSQLVPLLNMHGMGFEGLCIEINEEDKFSPEEKSKIDLELLKYYNIPTEYITAEYGTPVEKKEVEVDTVKAVKNKLTKYYS